MSYDSEVLADSPVSYFKFDETSGTTAVDAAGANDGTYTDGPTLGVAAGFVASTFAVELGTAFSNAYVALPPGAFAPGLGDWSVEGWVQVVTNLEAGFASAALYFQYITGDNGYLLIQAANVSVTGDIPRLSVIDTGSVICDPAFPNDHAWHYVVVTYNAGGNLVTVYIDGVSVDTGTPPLPSDLDAGGSENSIGGFGGAAFGGDVDNFALYHSTLSSARVTAHWNASLVPIVVPPPLTPGDGCVAIAVPGFVADGSTPDANGIVYSPTVVGGWWDSIPLRSATAEVQPRGEFVTVAQELGRDVDLVIVAHTLDGRSALGPVLCFTAIETIKAAFRIVFVPVAFQVVDPYADRTVQARRVGPIKQQILGKSVAVRASIPLLAPDPRRIPTP